MQAGSGLGGKPHFFHVQLLKAGLLLCLPPKCVCDGKEIKVRKLWDPAGILVGGKKSMRCPATTLKASEVLWVHGTPLLSVGERDFYSWPCRQSRARCLIGRTRGSRLAPFISTNGDYWEPTNFNASCRGMEGERGEQEMSRADVGE